MFRSISDNVIVTIMFDGGELVTATANMNDGKWNMHDFIGLKSHNPKVIAWRPFPEPMKV